MPFLKKLKFFLTFFYPLESFALSLERCDRCCNVGKSRNEFQLIPKKTHIAPNFTYVMWSWPFKDGFYLCMLQCYAIS